MSDDSKVPDYPFAGEAIGDSDKSAIAAAAWAQANGSIVAFEQLCREHAAGEIDLLATPAADETDEQKAEREAALKAKADEVEAAQLAEQQEAQLRAAQPAAERDAADAAATGTKVGAGEGGDAP